jgi:hypothetical protein
MTEIPRALATRNQEVRSSPDQKEDRRRHAVHEARVVPERFARARPTVIGKRLVVV